MSGRCCRAHVYLNFVWHICTCFRIAWSFRHIDRFFTCSNGRYLLCVLNQTNSSMFRTWSIKIKLHICDLKIVVDYFYTYRAKYFIASPNLLRVGVEETVSISVFDVNGEVDIQLSLQDFPLRRRTFSVVSQKVRKGFYFYFRRFWLKLALNYDHNFFLFFTERPALMKVKVCFSLF